MSSNTRCSGLSRQRGYSTSRMAIARFSDLNPIENVWDALGRQVSGRNYPPANKNTLIRALTEEWDKLPQQLLDNVVQSMVRRVECCITLHGGHIPPRERIKEALDESLTGTADHAASTYCPSSSGVAAGTVSRVNRCASMNFMYSIQEIKQAKEVIQSNGYRRALEHCVPCVVTHCPVGK
ncbi:transposable element Tcb2 transposase [Trichonephila clavipes]|nr:transposable element Tcb2 transposase [Trichonephila clavipes]